MATEQSNNAKEWDVIEERTCEPIFVPVEKFCAWEAVVTAVVIAWFAQRLSEQAALFCWKEEVVLKPEASGMEGGCTLGATKLCFNLKSKKETGIQLAPNMTGLRRRM